MVNLNELVNQKNKEGFGWQTKAPYDNGASKKGAYISN
jgi:hypothetical protein